MSTARQSDSTLIPPRIEDIRAARDRFDDRVFTTPLSRSHSFSRITAREVWLKAECLQRAGSFKIRGALNVVSRLAGEPVVAASAGNHAQGVALAAAFAGSPCTVFMPETAPIPKVNATREYGAEIRLTGTSLAEAVSAALDHSDTTGDRFIHPYDDPLIVAGQGTLGLEIVEQLPEVGTVIIPTGGGGLLAGTALAVKSLRPQAHVIGVEIDVAPTYLESRRAGRPVTVPVRPTLADGINVTVASELVFEMVEALVDDFVTVTDAQTTAALTLVLERAKLTTEPAGVVGVAALLEGLIPAGVPEPIVVVLSGGNIDLLLLGKYVRHGLEGSGRYAELRVRVPDQPGRLAGVLETIAGEGGNVVEVDHHREGFGLPFGTVEISIAFEAGGPEHTDRIRQALAEFLA
ncbi:MAG: threonine ammonia-lyase [Acidimicrobiia bacterium]